MLKYDHRQHALSDWLAELDQRFQLGEVGEDTNKIYLVPTPHWRNGLQHPF